MRILVTGATGLIGAHLAAALQSNHAVWAITRRPPTSTAHGAIQWIAGDLRSTLVIDQLPRAMDVVVHLAQSSHYREFPEQALDVFDVNVASTARLLDWSRNAGVQQFVLASSGAAHMAKSYYAASKQSAEALSEAYASLFGVLVLRFFFVYGRGQKPWMLVPRLIERVRSNQEIALPGGQGPRLNPVYVMDAVRATCAAVEGRVSGRIDIAGPEVLTLRGMCDEIGRQLSRPVRFVSDSTAPADHLVGDIGEMSRRLMTPACSFSDGVAAMLSGR